MATPTLRHPLVNSSQARRWSTPSRARRALPWILASVALAWGGRAGLAQTVEPSPAVADHVARLSVIAAAFEAIAERAALGDWQGADAAYNVAVAALDAERPPVEAALGEPAAAAFGQVEALLADLDEGLRGEDTARVRSAVSGIAAALATLAPELAPAALPRDATAIVLAWRDALPGLMTFGQAGQWIDMRNAAIALRDGIAGDARPVEQALPEEARPLVGRARLFADRLFIAALDQSSGDADAAAGLFSESVDAILVALGALPPPTPRPAPEGATRFRMVEVRGAVGDVVSLPIVGERIPSLGLGSYALGIRWSPEALRLADLRWELGEGTLRRDDAAGTAELTLPQAPSGPEGTAVLAQLAFEILSDRAEAADFLPAEALGPIQEAMPEALEAIRLGNLPAAATTLARAHAGLMQGRGRPGSLYESLAAHGLAEPLAESLLNAVDLATQAVETDRIVVAVDQAEGALADTLEAYQAAAAPAGRLPIGLELRSATDTLGAPIETLPSIPGAILVTGGAAGDRSPTPPLGAATTAPAAPIASSPAGGPTATPRPSPAAPSAQSGPSGFPPAALIGLALAFAAGLALIGWQSYAERQASASPDDAAAEGGDGPEGGDGRRDGG